MNRSDTGHRYTEHPIRGSGARSNLGDAERATSILGGGLLLVYGLRRRDWAGLGLGLAGATLIYRGASGRSRPYSLMHLSTRGGTLHADHADVDPESALSVRHVVTINRPAGELYAAWRDFGRLPHFIEQLERVDVTSDGRSHWVARAPGGRSLEWHAELVEDHEGERISWRTVDPTDLPHRGEIVFRPAPGERGTEVELELEYEPPGGRLGHFVSGRLDDPPGGRFGRSLVEFARISPAQLVKHSLRRFKQIMEAGEVPTTAGQPSGRSSVRPRAGRRWSSPRVPVSEKSTGRVPGVGESGVQRPAGERGRAA